MSEPKSQGNRRKPEAGRWHTRRMENRRRKPQMEIAGTTGRSCAGESRSVTRWTAESLAFDGELAVGRWHRRRIESSMKVGGWIVGNPARQPEARAEG